MAAGLAEREVGCPAFVRDGGLGSTGVGLVSPLPRDPSTFASEAFHRLRALVAERIGGLLPEQPRLFLRSLTEHLASILHVERRRSEQALQTSQDTQATLDLETSTRFFQQIAKTMPGVLFVYDLVEKRNLYVNHGGWEMLGYTEDDYLSSGEAFLQTALHPEDLARLPAMNEEYARAADGEVFTRLVRLKHKNGEWRWVRSNVTVFAWTPDGRPRQLIGTSIDVTETRTAEEELRQAAGQIAQCTRRGTPPDRA